MGVDATYTDYVCNLASYNDAAPTNVTPVSAAADADDASLTPESTESANQFYDQALNAFRQGYYRDATRLALHAAVDEPKNPDVHVLLMLGMFASGEYRGAAIEAHTVALLGKTPDWPKLFAVYGDADTYTKHLRVLEKYVREKPGSPEARFLLAFQYMMEGHKAEAKREFLEALKLAPRDRLTAQLLISQGGTVPEDIAKQLGDLTQKGVGVKTTPPPPPEPAPVKDPAPSNAAPPQKDAPVTKESSTAKEL